MPHYGSPLSPQSSSEPSIENKAKYFKNIDRKDAVSNSELIFCSQLDIVTRLKLTQVYKNVVL